MSRSPITESDLEFAERWLRVTLEHCSKLRGQQRHMSAANCAAGAIRAMRTLKEVEAHHGFFADFLLQPYAGAFEEFL